MSQEIEQFTDREAWHNGAPVYVSGRVYLENDPDYGADADGRRGSPRRSVAMVVVDQARDADGQPVELTPAIAEAAAGLFID